MSWGRCGRCDHKMRYCVCENRRASGKAAWEGKGRGRPAARSTVTTVKAPAPHRCPKCGSMVRGGVCPGRDC